MCAGLLYGISTSKMAVAELLRKLVTYHMKYRSVVDMPNSADLSPSGVRYGQTGLIYGISTCKMAARRKLTVFSVMVSRNVTTT